MFSGKHQWAAFCFCLGTVLLFFSSCSPEPEKPATQYTLSSDEMYEIDVWGHSGREGERKAIEQMVEDFNQKHHNININFTFLPEGSYNSQVQAAALAGDLPDVLEFDGPFVYNYVWQGQLIALDDLILAKVLRNLIPSIVEQGTYREKLYSIGQFDSGLALFGRRSLLEAVGARIPTSPEEAWTMEEFETLLADLAENDPDGQVLDLKLNYKGEWFTYAFSPALQSAGADLINRENFETASGVLNGTEAVRTMKHFQDWIKGKEYVDPNLDDNAFLGGRVALSWVGHWEFGRYSERYPDDLVLIPLPDFGRGTKTGQGSWNWGITTKCENPMAAMKFLHFLLEDDNILMMTKENAAIPATHSAVEKSSLHQEGGPLALYVEQLTGGYAVPRPRSPAYPVITSVFQKAFDNIRNGADVEISLDKAVTDINRDIEDNRGYPPVGE
jgi:multiple sugar transport system substrate-binding protein